MINNLEKRFITLCDKINVNNPKYEYSLLEKQYLFPIRQYHNLIHINNMLLEFDSIKKLSKNPNAIELAILYHDAIYTKDASSDDVKKSAELIKFLENRGNIDPKLMVDAYSLVIATSHKIIPSTIDEKIIIDCDLSILGKSKEEFELYNSNIRKEYEFVPWETYSKKRIEILQRFLDKPQIYNTDFFKDRYEVCARINLENAIKELKNANSG
ncbi:MAG: HD domain-containing protein [Candidatus Woesearchaeota archaeon]